MRADLRRLLIILQKLTSAQALLIMNDARHLKRQTRKYDPLLIGAMTCAVCSRLQIINCAANIYISTNEAKSEGVSNHPKLE